ncbi:MAG: cytochrome c biogenesis protein CcsA [Bacteroidetes bacterium]|nr:cytochrome c biogenesis protein CcsA [Bacteroidota bacterium]
MNFIGEHLIYGVLGKSFVWISFAASLISTVLFLFHFSRKENPLGMIRGIARSFYLLHVVSIFAVIVVLYLLIFRHYFEYTYVWQYSSGTLPIKYIISCFWAGQEGSFLVWGVCQAVLGLFLIRKAGEWESPVMGIVSLSQVFVTSMLLGVSIFGYQIGSSPFTLLRETYAGQPGSIFGHPDYLQYLNDGNGLNPLLENIWMTIHPPILFIGYALALVPFAYAIAALMKKDYQGWIRPSMPWVLLSLTFLGAGILLGGAWAYVSLTFGGFWAWDPVENSSLVPWLTLVAALHFIIISRRQHFGLLFAFLFSLLSYILVLYATFLTRSGVLSETSAHSFGDNGLTAQLLVYLLFFLTLVIVLFGMNITKIIDRKKDEILSKEFWMFIGSLIIALAAFQIIFTTSIPVFNKVLGTHLAPPTDNVAFYNRWQMPYALLVAVFIGFSQFLNYSSNRLKEALKKLALPAILALLASLPFLISGIVTQPAFVLFLYFILFGFFAIIANIIFKTSFPGNTGALIAHLGFIIFLLGTLITFSNSRVISTNTSRYDMGNEKSNAENLMLVKNDTLYMAGFYVTYVNKSRLGNTTFYRVDFLRMKEGKLKQQFSLYPSVNVHPRMGAVYNPATRHYPLIDYYTYIAQVGEGPDYIVIKAIMNPFINVLWAGALLLVFGLTYSTLRRLRLRRASV